MRPERTGRSHRPQRARPVIGGGGGGGPTSAAAPSSPGDNGSVSSIISPANWAGAVGDAFLMAFSAETFTTGGAYSFAPTEGEVIAYAEANDGATWTVCGLWWIPSYSGSGNPDLGITIQNNTVNTTYNKVWFWDVSAGATKPTQVLAYDEFCAIPGSGSTTYAGADGGNWTRVGTALDGPAIDTITDGTNWIQGRMFYAGDDDTPTDTDVFYDLFEFISSVAGTDMTIGAGFKIGAAAPLAAADGTITQLDFGTAVGIGGLNFLLGT